MNKKILSIATAAALVAPLAAVQAEIKMSGTIQAEIGSVEAAGGDAVTTSTDSTGALGIGGGPNTMAFDMNEDVGGGLNAFGRMEWGFNTTTTANSGTNMINREKYVGLEMKNGAYFLTGRTNGAYKRTHGMIDPFGNTGAQMRAGGGQSGGGGDNQFSHGSYVDHVVELGYNRAGKSGFAATLQAVVDEADKYDGSFLGNVKYSSGPMAVYGAVSQVSENAGMGIADDMMNWKVGGSYKMGGLTLGLQYEDAEIGISRANLFSMGSNEGQFVTGSASYGMGNVLLAGWVGGFMDSEDFNDGAGSTSGDALSFSVGAAYTFSKNTMVYAAYHQTDSDSATAGNDEAYDWTAFAAGLRHKF